MITIGKTYLVRAGGSSRLCADLSVDGRGQAALWFSVDHTEESGLCTGRADAFAMALLPMAVREGHEIVCEDPLSDRLYYQLNEELIPAMVLACNEKAEHFPRIRAPLCSTVFPHMETVAAVFSGRETFLRTLADHRPGSLYPLTHIAVWNTAGIAEQESFRLLCQEAEKLSDAWQLHPVIVDTNFDQVIHEDLAAVRTFRELACALAIEKLLSVCLLPTLRCAADFRINMQDSEAYALLITNCASTESLAFYLSGPEAEAARKGAHSRQQLVVIGAPYIEERAESTRLCARITLPGQEQVMWFSVKPEYGRYLTRDRTDAFVAALLTPAMRAGADIICQAPVSRRLLYQLNQYLIPMMALNMPSTYHFITLQAEPAQTVPVCAGAVCTGGTAGVDSLFTIYQDREIPADSRYKLTHLFLTSNGAIERGVLSETLQLMADRAERKVTPGTDLKTICIDSNLSEVLSENFLSVVDVRHAAVLLALQKLFGVGLVSASYSFARHEFIADNMAYYELVVLSCFSTQSTVLCSSGGAFSRFNKLRFLGDFPLAQQALHPCIDETAEGNCGKCLKCTCVEVDLYTLGVLEKFSAVFDTETFRRKKILYLAKVLNQCWPKPLHTSSYMDAVKAIKNNGENLLPAKVLALVFFTFRKFRSLLRRCAQLVRRTFSAASQISKK